MPAIETRFFPHHPKAARRVSVVTKVKGAPRLDRRGKSNHCRHGPDAASVPPRRWQTEADAQAAWQIVHKVDATVMGGNGAGCDGKSKTRSRFG
jgi:hypothetical protein